MRKTILVLLVLMLAADAMALSVSCTQSGGQTCVVSYNGALPDPNRPRAFAFDVSLSNSKTISSFATSNTDYYIYPGTIDINANDGTVTSWGSPVAGGGNGQTSMIIEMGSLYATNDANHKNAPPAAGTLFTFDVSATTTVTVGKNAARGGVVKENGKSDLADTVCTCAITVATAPVLSGTVTLQNLTAGMEVGKVVTIQIVTAGNTPPAWNASDPNAGCVEGLRATLASGGAYTATCAVTPAGTYDIYFKVNHWLRKKVAGVVLSSPTTVNASLSYNGDVNNDNAISVTDLGLLRTNYLQNGVGLQGDLNEDGAVNVTDLGILRTNYLQAGD